MPFCFFSNKLPKSSSSPICTTIILVKVVSKKDENHHLATEQQFSPNHQDDISLYRLLEQQKTDEQIQQPNCCIKLPKKKVTFSDEIEVLPTFSSKEYDRRGEDECAIKSLNAKMAILIRNELNEFKRQMEIHPDSKKYTQFYAM